MRKNYAMNGFIVVKKLCRYAKGRFVSSESYKKWFALRIQVSFTNTMIVYANTCKCFYDVSFRDTIRSLCDRSGATEFDYEYCKRIIDFRKSPCKVGGDELYRYWV